MIAVGVCCDDEACFQTHRSIPRAVNSVNGRACRGIAQPVLYLKSQNTIGRSPHTIRSSLFAKANFFKLFPKGPTPRQKCKHSRPNNEPAGCGSRTLRKNGMPHRLCRALAGWNVQPSQHNNIGISSSFRFGFTYKQTFGSVSLKERNQDNNQWR